MTARSRLRAASVAVAALVLATSCSLVPGAGQGTYEVHAEFRRGIGLFPGSPVRLLGIDVGTVTDVRTEGDRVEVDMDIHDDTDLPADAFAVVVPVTALGERYIQVGPAHDDGPVLEGGDTIPLGRTDVPYEIDELLEGLDSYLGAIDPANATDLVENLAAIVDGQGEEINELLATGSDTLGILADKGDELGAVVDALAELTEALGGRTETIQDLVRSYEVVAGALADNRQALNGFIVNLNRAAVEVRGLLERNDANLRTSVGELTTVGRTLRRNISRIDTLLAETPRLFTAARNAYDAEHNWLPLNNQDEPSTTQDLYKSRVRDRLAGICRRLFVRLAGTPSGAALAATGCRDTASPFWDRFLADAGIPGEDADSGGGEDEPAPPDPDVVVQEVERGLELLLELLDGQELQALRGLEVDLLDAIDGLSPPQVRALGRLNSEQIAALRNVPAGRLGTTIDRLIAGSIDPSDLLDQPTLPPAGGGGGGNFVSDLLGGVG